MKYIESHLHTTYSLLDGLITIDGYLEFLKTQDISSAFITDHGSFSGAIEFYKKSKSNNIKPILGQEFYLTEKDKSIEEKEELEQSKLSKEEKDSCKGKINDNRHLILFCKNNIGYKNMLDITTYANLERFYYKPRLDYKTLESKNEGLICTSACIGSDINQAILNDNFEKAESLILYYYNIFGDDFYIEFQNHFLEEEYKCNKFLLTMIKKHNINHLITNDVHYLTKKDAYYHDFLLSKGKKLNDEKRFRFPNNEFYYKNYNEIKELFKDYDLDFINSAIENTYKIIDKCNVDIILGQPIMPHFVSDENISEIELLKKQVKIGLKNRFSTITKEILDRVNYELSVIIKMGFEGYFLIVQDYINFAKRNDIPVGVARGSSAGSIVAYLLGITEVNPLEYDLIFERFLNPDRFSLPDIDTDFCIERRHEVIAYLKEKYGNENVTNICTFGVLKPRSAVKTVASSLDYSFDFGNSLSKKIEPTAKSLKQELEENEDLKTIYSKSNDVKTVINVALNIEGNLQSIGEHAAGVIISDQNIKNICPIIKTKDGNATAYNDKTVELLGLVKYDILGLKNLTVIKKCVDLIKKRYNINIDINKLDLKNKKTYKMLQNGKSLGVFQLESNGMVSLLKRLKPTELKHLDAVIALFRPGPIKCGATEEYVINKNNSNKIKYDISELKPILDSTYGVKCYQEQIMKICTDLAGYTMLEADEIRRCIGKKLIDEIIKHETKFIDGCVNNNIDKIHAKKLYDDIVGFAAYSFNKSHSVSYAIIAYQTAYLKANYTLEYMTVLLNSVSDNKDKMNEYISECFRMGINILPPDINISTNKFEIDENNNIRFGFNAIKGIGENSISIILKEREKGCFKSFWDFVERTKSDKTTIEVLLKVGAFNKIENGCKSLLNVVPFIQKAKTKDENIKESVIKELANSYLKEDEKYLLLLNNKRQIKGASKKAKGEKEEINKQIESIFQQHLEQSSINFELKENFTDEEIKENENDLIGYSLTTNVFLKLSKFDNLINYTKITELLDENNNKDYIDSEIKTIGEIKNIRNIKTKNNQDMSFIEIEYFGNTISFTVFSNLFEEVAFKDFKKGDLVYVKGLMKINNLNNFSDYNFILQNISRLNIFKNKKYVVDFNNKTKEDLIKLSNILTRLSLSCYNNNMDINYIVCLKIKDKIKMLDNRYWINDKAELKELLYFEGLL